MCVFLSHGTHRVQAFLTLFGVATAEITHARTKEVSWRLMRTKVPPPREIRRQKHRHNRQIMCNVWTEIFGFSQFATLFLP
jgi:hypothetical protein